MSTRRVSKSQFLVLAIVVAVLGGAVVVIASFHKSSKSVSTTSQPRSVTLSPSEVNSALSTMCSSPVYAIIGNGSVIRSHGASERSFFQDATSELYCDSSAGYIDVLFYSTSGRENSGVENTAGAVWKNDNTQRPLYPTIDRWIGRGYLVQAALLTETTMSQRKIFFSNLLSKFGPITTEEAPLIRWHGVFAASSLADFGNPSPQLIG